MNVTHKHFQKFNNNLKTPGKCESQRIASSGYIDTETKNAARIDSGDNEMGLESRPRLRQHVKTGSNDFLSMLQEIQGDRKQTKWRPEGPEEQKKVSFAIRKVNFNHYEPDIVSTEKLLLLLQGAARPLVVMTEKLRRHLTGKEIYTALQGWGRLLGETEYQQGTENEDEPQSAPDNAPVKTHGKEKTWLRRDFFQSTWRCICIDIFPDDEYARIARNHNDSRLI